MALAGGVLTSTRFRECSTLRANSRKIERMCRPPFEPPLSGVAYRSRPSASRMRTSPSSSRSREIVDCVAG
jgi:hypothetical protein